MIENNVLRASGATFKVFTSQNGWEYVLLCTFHCMISLTQ